MELFYTAIRPSLTFAFSIKFKKLIKLNLALITGHLRQSKYPIYHFFTFQAKQKLQKLKLNVCLKDNYYKKCQSF